MTNFTNSDAAYAPGGAYDKGYQARMKGESINSRLDNLLDENAFHKGWHDADMTLLREARKRNGIVEGGGGCCKTFIQD